MPIFRESKYWLRVLLQNKKVGEAKIAASKQELMFRGGPSHCVSHRSLQPGGMKNFAETELWSSERMSRDDPHCLFRKIRGITRSWNDETQNFFNMMMFIKMIVHTAVFFISPSWKRQNMDLKYPWKETEVIVKKTKIPDGFGRWCLPSTEVDLI